MAEMTIRLRCDPVTGKKDIVVTLQEDPDALPHEHEQKHRQLVDRLIEGGLLRAGEVGRVVVERPARGAEGVPEAAAPEPEARRASEQSS